MKRLLLVVLAILLVGSAAGGAWYWRRTHDPLRLGREAMQRGELRAAQLLLRSAVRDNPRSAEAHLRLGTVQLRLGDAVAAEKELKLARAAGASPPALRPSLARAYLAQARFADVLKEFEVGGLPPEEAGPVLVSRALAHLGLQQLPAAQQDVAAAERLTPDLIEVPLAAARIALASKDAAAAGRQVERALRIDPHSPDALLLQGELLQARGDHAGAVEAFGKALTVSPGSVPIRLQLAGALTLMHRDAEAREQVEAVLKADARNPLGNYLLAVLRARARAWPDADAALQRISPVLSSFPRGDYVQALVKVNLDQVEQATEAARRYVAHAPRDVAGYRLLAGIEARAGRPQQVAKVLQQAVDAGVADAEVLELLGGAYIRLGQRQLAAQMLDQAAGMGGGDAGLLARIGALRLGIGDAGGAERDLTRALELAPDNSGTGENLVIAALAAGDADRAAAELDKLRRRPGGDAAKLGNLLGLVRLGQLDLDGARQAFEAVLQADATAAAARLNLARVLVLQDRPEQAEQLLLEVLDKEPANAAALSTILPILLAQKQTGRMLTLMQAARRAMPDNAGLTVAQAGLLAKTGEPRQALDLLERMPPQQAMLPEVLSARAPLEQALDLERQAQGSWRSLLAAMPGDADARRLLAASLLRSGEAGEARTVLRKGLEVTPGNLPLLQAYVSLDFRTGGLDPALTTAGVLAKEPANLPAARLLRGGLYMSLRRYADAVAAFRAELKADPSPVLAMATAAALGAAGREAEARQLLQDWVAAHPTDVEVTGMLAGLDLQAHRAADAEAHLRAVLALRPNDATALNNLAWIYQERGDRRARALAQKAFLLSPGPQSADTLGWVLAREGNTSMALMLLGQAARQRNDDPTIAYHLAVALNADGRKQQALGLLRQIVDAKAEFDDKPAARQLLEQLGAAAQ